MSYQTTDNHRNNWAQLSPSLFPDQLFFLKQSKKYTRLVLFEAPGRELRGHCFLPLPTYVSSILMHLVSQNWLFPCFSFVELLCVHGVLSTHSEFESVVLKKEFVIFL